MNFSIKERLLVVNIDTLPQSGSIVTMKIKKDLMDEMGFSEKEIADYGITNENGQLKWSSSIDKDVNIGDQGIKLLIEALEKSENLSDQFVPLYERLKEVTNGIQ